MVLYLAPAIGLSGCVAELVGGLVNRPAPAPPAGEEVIIEPNGSEIILPAPEAEPMCYPRARHFHGLVAVPCVEIGKETTE